MDWLQPALIDLWTIFKANFGQIAIAFTGVVGTIMVGYLASLGPRGANRLAREKLMLDQESKERDDEIKLSTQEQQMKLEETREIFKRQEDLYDRTHRLVATLERRLELQTKEAAEERELLKTEVKGFRRQVARLERRVAQLVTAFREATGKEPPPPEPDPDDDDADDKKRHH